MEDFAEVGIDPGLIVVARFESIPFNVLRCGTRCSVPSLRPHSTRTSAYFQRSLGLPATCWPAISRKHTLAIVDDRTVTREETWLLDCHVHTVRMKFIAAGKLNPVH